MTAVTKTSKIQVCDTVLGVSRMGFKKLHDSCSLHGRMPYLLNAIYYSGDIVVEQIIKDFMLYLVKRHRMFNSLIK